MPYDEGLAERIRGVFLDRTDVAEKRMFGGIAFMVRGRMCVGIVKEDLMVRVGAAAHDALAQEPNARPMDFTGRPMKGFLFVSPDGFESDAELERWIARGVAHATSLPEKTPRAARPTPRKAVRRPEREKRRRSKR
jgi:TfoX/Sxy family transcriptional regulator of competence genes